MSTKDFDVYLDSYQVKLQEEKLISQISTRVTDLVDIEGLRLGSETDIALVTRLISLGYKRLLLANKTYTLGTLDISNIVGLEIRGVKRPFYDGSLLQGGTIINGTIFGNGTKNCEIYSLGITNTNDDGIRLHNGSCSNKIKDVVAVVGTHGFLIESYGSDNIDNEVDKCIAFGGVHGFVSKSKGTKFTKCVSDGASTNGFVLCSDNMTSASVSAICSLNVVDKCVARKTNIGYNLYCRDYFSTTNANNITHMNTVLSNCISDTCASYGVIVGDDGAPPTGTTFNAVKNVTINGHTCINCTTSDMLFANCSGVTVDGCNINGYPTIRDMTKAKNINWGNNNSGFSIADLAYWTVLTANSATPSVDVGRQYYKTANTATTSITNFLGNRRVGQVIYVTINDDFTTIVQSGTIKLNKYKISGKGSFAILKLDPTGGFWEEIYSCTTNQNQYWAYATDMTINFDYGNIADSYITANVNSITLSTPKAHGVYYLTLRANGNYTITTWDSRIKWISPLATLSNGNRITVQLLWNGSSFIQLTPVSTTVV
jgi:hypothetical protein